MLPGVTLPELGVELKSPQNNSGAPGTTWLITWLRCRRATPIWTRRTFPPLTWIKVEKVQWVSLEPVNQVSLHRVLLPFGCQYRWVLATQTFLSGFMKSSSTVTCRRTHSWLQLNILLPVQILKTHRALFRSFRIMVLFETCINKLDLFLSSQATISF